MTMDMRPSAEDAELMRECRQILRSVPNAGDLTAESLMRGYRDYSRCVQDWGDEEPDMYTLQEWVEQEHPEIFVD